METILSASIKGKFKTNLSIFLYSIIFVKAGEIQLCRNKETLKRFISDRVLIGQHKSVFFQYLRPAG